jgi:anti-anti-sigma factor
VTEDVGGGSMVDSGFANRVSVVSLPQRIDATNTAHFYDTVRKQIAHGGRTVVLDFSLTEAIDSTGLGVIIRLYKQLRASGRGLFVTRIGDGVRRVLAMTRLDRILSTRDASGGARFVLPPPPPPSADASIPTDGPTT